MRLSLTPLTRWLRRGAETQAIVHPGMGGGYGDLLGQYGIVGAVHPGSDRNWAEDVQDPSICYAVFACLRWIADNLPEPKRQVVDVNAAGEFTPRAQHSLLDLLERPNDFYDGDALFTATARDYATTGNAYWVIERDNLQRPLYLWHVPFWMISPRWDSSGKGPFVVDYLYRPQNAVGGSGIPVKRQDVVHFQWGLDTRTGGRLGWNRTAAILPWLASLNEGAVYTASILREMGVPANLLLSEQVIPVPAKQSIITDFKAMFTRDKRGGLGILDGAKLTWQQLGLSPNDLGLEGILDRPECVVCAIMGIPPSVIFLGNNSGAKGLDNGGQHEQARKAAYHDCLMPMTKRFGKTISHKLLPQMEGASFRAAVTSLIFDFGSVQALQEDQTELYKRNDSSVLAGWLKVGEARGKAKFPSDDSDMVYLRPSKAVMVKTADEEVEPPTPPALPSGEPDEDDANDPAK